MKLKTINAVGKACPIPVIEAKKALDEKGCNGVEIYVDNMTSVQNLEKLAASQDCSFTYKEAGEGCYGVLLSKSGQKTADVRDIEPDSGGVVVIGRDTMGEGSEELGKILIKGFIYALAELNTLPSHIIFFNSGARLTIHGASTTDDLKRLAERGTKILTCGTCLDYYGIKDNLAVGNVANMYEIATAMSAASKVINI